MKIQTIIEQIDPIVKTRFLKRGLTGNTGEKTTINPRGEGLGAVVYDDPKDPHTVNRVGKWRANDEHGTPETVYKSFIDFLLKNKKLADNPYFPRIYDITHYVDNSGMRKSRYKIEKLRHIEDSHIAIAMMNKIFGENLEKVLFFYDYTESQLQNENVVRIVDIIAKEVIKCIIRGNKNNHIIDHKFLEACFALANSGVPKTRLDIRYPNLMYRTGPTGPQLVITDPFV